MMADNASNLLIYNEIARQVQIQAFPGIIFAYIPPEGIYALRS
jgi:hypothetical protein